MSWEAWVTAFVIMGAFVVMARDRYPTSMVLTGGVVMLMTLGVITPAEALQGFSNPAPITVAALYVVARAVEKTGVLEPAVRSLLGKDQKPGWVLARLTFPAAAASAFLNNTPIVAMMVPQVVAWCRTNGLSPSRYLMPLSFAAILGGMVTLIGTSTNLIVSGLLTAHGMEPLGMFEITPLGLPIALIGLVVMVVLAPRILPLRVDPEKDTESNVREYGASMIVTEGGPVDGKSVTDAGLRNLEGVYLIEIQRESRDIAPVEPSTVLRGGDLLTFAGRADTVVDLHSLPGLQSSEEEHLVDLDSPHHTFFEVVIGASSLVLGRTVKGTSFRSRYGAAVVAIHRSGQRLNEKPGSVRLRVGDTLLLLSDAGFASRWRDRSDFLLIAQLGGAPPKTRRNVAPVILIAASMVVAAGLGLAPIVTLALVAALLMVLMGALTPAEARGAIDLDVIVTIASAFGLAASLETSGIAESLGTFLSGTLGNIAPEVALFGLALTTIALKSVITNNAAAAIMFPIAVSAATGLGVDVRSFAIVVAISASASFLTPIAYQTNLMVYGPGGYRFSDYARLGIPLVIVMLLVLAFDTSI